MPWEAERRGTDRRRQPDFCGSRAVEASTGSPWRDLPDKFGTWNAVFKRFDYWSDKGVWTRIFEALSDDPDMEYAMIDGTIVPVHRHGHGASLTCSLSRLGFAARVCKAVGLAEAAQSWGWNSETTVDQTLIRGLDTAFRVFVSGLSSV